VKAEKTVKNTLQGMNSVRRGFGEYGRDERRGEMA
jgi:hypothetical protein